MHGNSLSASAALIAGLLALAGPSLADPPYIYGLHDPGGEGHMGANKGWIVFTVEIGSNPDNMIGGNYSTYANQGYGVIVRLNNGYGSAGTIPHDSQYDNFATRCANYIKASSGVNYWIIGNEPNLPREWPGNVNGNPSTGQPITVARYVSCYIKCYNQIKAVASNAKICPAPAGTWSPPWPGQGIEGFVDYWVNCLNGIGASRIDGLILHAYTHGCDLALVTNTAKMGPPYQDIYYHFFVYRNYMTAIPADMRTKPVLITECDQNIECADNATPRQTWANVNSGWVREIYKEINNWNSANSQKIRCVALFRWPTVSEGEFTFGISGLNGVIQDFEQACALGYKWGNAPPAAPTGLTATASPGQVSLTWNASPNAASYRIKRATAFAGPYSVIASRTTTSYTNTGLTNGTTYYYVVSAVNDGGESPNSAPVSARPAIKGDLDFDGDVDMDDFGLFQVCFTGSGIVQSDPNCATSRLDSDDDVDGADLAIFQSCLSGPNVPAEADCAP